MDITEKPVEKVSLVNKASNDIIANYDQEMTSLWLQYGHPEDIKEPTVKSWRSWEEGAK